MLLMYARRFHGFETLCLILEKNRDNWFFFALRERAAENNVGALRLILTDQFHRTFLLVQFYTSETFTICQTGIIIFSRYISVEQVKKA